MADHGGPAAKAANNKKRDLSVSMARANVVGPLLVLPPVSVLYLAYGALWGFGVRFEIGGLAGLAALYAANLATAAATHAGYLRGRRTPDRVAYPAVGGAAGGNGPGSCGRFIPRAGEDHPFGRCASGRGVAGFLLCP